MKFKWSLAIFAPIYGFVVWVRNKLFDLNILKSEDFDVPVISVGNVAVGGTGKTPHIEYLISILSREYRIAVLSRGYKRKSKGYILACENSSAEEIGDEPYQIKRKFPNITVAVDADRRRGIRNLIEIMPEIEVILLDDAFQHRYVTPLISVLLTDYNRMLYDDALLPLGRLREPASARYRANAIIVTRCPDNISPIDRRILIKRLELYPFQHLFFTATTYGNIVPLSKNIGGEKVLLKNIKHDARILAVSGIANPNPFDNYLRTVGVNIETIHFSDHHDFTTQDIRLIEHNFLRMKTLSPHIYIITTEKDAARLVGKELPDTIKDNIYVLPISVVFTKFDNCDFDKYIKDSIFANRRIGKKPSDYKINNGGYG
ncbi:MAG: tetraacyldisaccharide 4'-kinase [Bacteroidales bacterium]